MSPSKKCNFSLLTRVDRIPTVDDDCSACLNNARDAAELPIREAVFIDDHWRVFVHRSAITGWLVVALRRHVLTLAEITPDESAALGPLLTSATQALIDVTGCIKTYVMLFAEGMPHLHFNLVPRMADLPEEFQGPKVFGYEIGRTPLDAEGRDAVARRLVAAWPQ